MEIIKLIDTSTYVKHQFPEWLYAEYQLTYPEFNKDITVREQIAIIWQFLGYSMVIPNMLTDNDGLQITKRIITTYDKAIDYCLSHDITITPSEMSYNGLTLKDALKYSANNIKRLSLRDALIDYVPGKVKEVIKEKEEVIVLNYHNKENLPF